MNGEQSPLLDALTQALDPWTSFTADDGGLALRVLSPAELAIITLSTLAEFIGDGLMQGDGTIVHPRPVGPDYCVEHNGIREEDASGCDFARDHESFEPCDYRPLVILDLDDAGGAT